MKLELQATAEEVMRAVEAVQSFAESVGLPPKGAFGLALALEECGSNIVNHALPQTSHRSFQVSWDLVGRDLVVELRDRGPAFDPTAMPARAPAEDDDLPGGWGVHLALKNVAEMRYARVGEENVLRLVQHLPATATSTDPAQP